MNRYKSSVPYFLTAFGCCSVAFLWPELANIVGIEELVVLPMAVVAATLVVRNVRRGKPHVGAGDLIVLVLSLEFYAFIKLDLLGPAGLRPGVLCAAIIIPLLPALIMQLVLEGDVPLVRATVLGLVIVAPILALFLLLPNDTMARLIELSDKPVVLIAVSLAWFLAIFALIRWLLQRAGSEE